jgi:uncharacterized protein (TIGR00730 family)
MAAVCVYCASSPDIDARFVDLASAVGRRIGLDGHELVSGGGRVSMMGAVAAAARENGARTTGVIPRHLMPLEVADADADLLVVVETMRERKARMDDQADVFLVLPGGIGTLEEFFEVWTSLSLTMHAKPVIVLDHQGFYEPLWAWLETLVDAGFVRRPALDGLDRVATVDEAFAKIGAVN